MIIAKQNGFRLVGAALLPALLLVACFQSPAPSAPVTPAPGAGTPALPAPPARSEPLHSLGLVELTFSGLREGSALQVSAHGPSGIQASGLTDQGSIQLQALSNGTFTTGKRGVDGVRYLYTTFQVRNANSAGIAYATPRQNLTLVAVSTASTVPNTPYSKVRRFDGSDASASIAPTILPTAGLQFNRQTEAPGLLSGAEDLQVYAENEVTSLVSVSVTRAFPYGFVVRNLDGTSPRTLPANPAVNAFDGLVTIALKLPLQATVADDPFTFNMTFAVVDDSVTRVTESLEEQAAGTVQARAAALGAGTQVALLCGSSYSGPNGLFIGSVTTAGGVGTDRITHIGGDMAMKTVPTAYSAIGNVNLNVPVNTGLGQFYSAYPTTPGGMAATLAFGGNSTSRGGSLNVSGDGSFTFTSKAGDGTPAVTDNLNYTVSDGHGCTSPTQTAPVNVNGRVWFGKDNAAAGGDGRQSTPFNSLTNLQNAGQNNDTLYLYRGSGTFSGGLTLKPNQALIGEGAVLTVGATTVLPAGAQNSAISNAGGAGLTLGTGNTVMGLNITGSTAGITGNNFGILNATLGSVTGTAGPALNLSNGTANATITRLDATSPSANGTGVNLVGVGGTLTVQGSGGPSSGGVVQASGSGGIGYSIQPGSANLNLNLNWVRVQSSGLAGLLFQTQAADSGSLTLNLQNGSFQEDTSASIQLNPAGTGNNKFTVNATSITHPSGGGGIIYSPQSRSAAITDNGHITNNTISVAAAGSGNAITVDQNGAGNSRFEIKGNTITNFGTYGISVSAQQAGLGRLDAIIQNNTISSASGNGLDGINMLSGTATTGDNNTLCVNATGNNAAAATGSAGTAGLVVRQRVGTTFILPGIADTTNTGVVNYLQGNNPPSTARVRSGTTLTPVNGTCNAPS